MTSSPSTNGSTKKLATTEPFAHSELLAKEERKRRLMSDKTHEPLQTRHGPHPNELYNSDSETQPGEGENEEDLDYCSNLRTIVKMIQDAEPGFRNIDYWEYVGKQRQGNECLLSVD